MITKDENFWIKPVGNDFEVGFTPVGLRSFGVLFVCQPLVEKSQKINGKTKLFAIEGISKLTCMKGLFSEGSVKDIALFNDPCEINPETPLILITGTPNALHFV